MDRLVGAKLNLAVTFCKKGKIVAAAHKSAGAIMAAALPDKDTAGADKLAAEGLYTEPL